MPGSFTKLVVADPHLIGRAVWESLPLTRKAVLVERVFGSREWKPLDERRFRLDPESYRSEYSIANLGGLLAERIADSRATQFRIRPPAEEAVCFTVFERGAGRLVLPGSREPTIGTPAAGLIRGNDPGTWSSASDGNSRLVLLVPAMPLCQRLEALLDGPKVETVEFAPAFDPTRGAGATIRRMLGFLFAELEHSDSLLLSNEIALRSFEENLALSLLLGLPHNHSEDLQRQKTAAAPGNVRRAEAFMRANACMPLTIAEIADAAGCGIRALQIAFQRFRGTTPMGALQRARLDQARTEMLRPGQTDSLARIAAAHGFSNQTRFTRLFRRTYSVSPSEILRTGRDTLAGQRDLPRPALRGSLDDDPVARRWRASRK